MAKNTLEKIVDYITGLVLKKSPNSDPKLIKELVKKKLDERV